MRRETISVGSGCVVCLAVLALASALPEAWYDAVFCRFPARLAAAYFHAGLDASSFVLGNGRVVAVTRECGGSGFFALICGVLTWHAVRRDVTSLLPLGLLAAWCFTMAINAMRVVVTVWSRVFAENLLPERFFGAVHLVSGVLVFFPALVLLWLLCVRHDLSATSRHAR